MHEREVLDHRDRSRRQPPGAQTRHERACEPGSAAARGTRGGGKLAHARAHGERDHVGSVPRCDSAEPAAADGHSPLDRRFRNRLLVARIPQTPAGDGDQDRPLVRLERRGGRGRRRDRPVHHPTRRESSSRRRCRGCRDRGHMRCPGRIRLPPRAGLLPRTPAAGPGARAVAARPARPRRTPGGGGSMAVKPEALTVRRLKALLEVTSVVRGEKDLASVLSTIVRTVAEALEFRTVVLNLYRPAFDDFCVTTIHGSAEAQEALLGSTYDWESWQQLLVDRFRQ